MPTTLAGAPRCPPTGPCWPAASNHEHFSLSKNGQLFATRKSSRTGNGPATANPCWLSRHCPRMVNVSENYLPTVTGVAVIGKRVLRVLFSDGTVGDVDFAAEQWTGVLEPLNDPDFFALVTVDTESGTIAWPNGIDLAPEPLYEQAHAHPLVAA